MFVPYVHEEMLNITIIGRTYRNPDLGDKPLKAEEVLEILFRTVKMEDISAVIGIGRNIFKIETYFSDERDEILRRGKLYYRGLSIELEPPEPPTQTINIYSCPTNFSATDITNALSNYVDIVLEVKEGTYKRYGHIKNGMRHVKYKNNKKPLPQTITIKGTKLELRRPGESLRTKRCYKCNGEGHLKEDCPSDTLCYSCGEIGHLSNRCPFEGRMYPNKRQQGTLYNNTEQSNPEIQTRNDSDPQTDPNEHSSDTDDEFEDISTPEPIQTYIDNPNGPPRNTKNKIASSDVMNSTEILSRENKTRNDLPEIETSGIAITNEEQQKKQALDLTEDNP